MMLEETHSSEGVVKVWTAEWGGRIFFSHGLSNSQGVAILVGRNFAGCIVEETSDSDGRHISLRIEMADYSLVVTNIYAPNKDNPEFFNCTFKWVRAMQGDQNIIGGDFNLVMNTSLDSKNRKQSHHKSLKVIKEFMEQGEWCDIYRVLNDKCRYTCFSKRPLVCACLDYYLVSLGLINMVNSHTIMAILLSDHSLVEICIKLSDLVKGRGHGNLTPLC